MNCFRLALKVLGPYFTTILCLYVTLYLQFSLPWRFDILIQLTLQRSRNTNNLTPWRKWLAWEGHQKTIANSWSLHGDECVQQESCFNTPHKNMPADPNMLFKAIAVPIKSNYRDDMSSCHSGYCRKAEHPPNTLNVFTQHATYSTLGKTLYAKDTCWTTYLYKIRASRASAILTFQGLHATLPSYFHILQRHYFTWFAPFSIWVPLQHKLTVVQHKLSLL